MKEYLSPRQAARAIGASEASLKRWCDQGLLPAVRTGGGHRRLPVSGVVSFIRQRGITIRDPAVLGMPATTGAGPGTLAKARDRMRDALRDGDGDKFRAAAFDLYLSGQSIAVIGDQVISPVFEELGQLWDHGNLEIYQERRAIEICTQWLYEVRPAVGIPEIDAPYALGATLSGDPYSMPTTIVEVALLEAGWRAESHGVNHPLHTLQAAVLDKRPRMVWVSFSIIPNESELLREWPDFYDACAKQGTLVVVGGRALTDELRRSMKYSAFCDTLDHLVTYTSEIAGRRTQPVD
ncbi:MAG: helix-turn-helix domain-containing protein [Phycisphaerae bacterium]